MEKRKEMERKTARHDVQVDEFSLEKEGIVLFGRCYHPQQDPYGQHPAMLLTHEFASNMNSPSRYAIPFSKMGYHVFVFDFTGSKGTKSYGREDIEASILTDKEEMEIIFHYMRKQDYVDKDHIILGGCSQGGLTAALLAAEYKEDVEALLMYYPAICAPDYLRRGYMMGKSFDVNNVPEYIEMFHGTGIGRKYVKDVITLEPWKEIMAFEKPVLICHGIKDTIADISYSREAAKRYKDCKLVEFESGEHIFKKEENFQAAIDATIDFLQQRIFA